MMQLEIQMQVQFQPNFVSWLIGRSIPVPILITDVICYDDSKAKRNIAHLADILP